MPKISNVAVCSKRDKDSFDIVEKAPKSVQSKFALFLQAYRTNGFDKDKAMEKVCILPGQLHRWLKKYPEFKRRMEICEEGIKDFAEKRLMNFMKMDNKLGMVSTLFYLKTKCQDRGYVEQIQFTGVVENRYQKEIVDAVSNAANYGNKKLPIDVTPMAKQIESK